MRDILAYLKILSVIGVLQRKMFFLTSKADGRFKFFLDMHDKPSLNKPQTYHFTNIIII